MDKTGQLVYKKVKANLTYKRTDEGICSGYGLP
jgi:hypothetical protein